MVELQSLGNDVLDREMVLADLSDNAKRLFVELSRFQCCLLILHFLHSNAATLLTADDVAYRVDKPIATIDKDLSILAQRGMVQTTTVAGITFYRFTTNPAQQKLAQELCTWQDRWETRIRDIVHLIWGNEPSVTYAAPLRPSDTHSVFQSTEKPTRRWVSVSPNAVNGGENG